MDAANNRANLRRICSLLACIAVACNGIASTEGNPGTLGENDSDRLGDDAGAGIGNILHHPSSERCSASHSQGVNRPMMIVSTVDGKVLALDIQNAGQQQWSMDAGVGPLLSSSISQFEIMGPEGLYKVIPSLNGGLFKWDGETLEAVPLTAETLLSTSFRLNEETMMVGGKEINTFGINARTGELHYICGTGGCQLYGDEAEDDQDIIVIQHTRQTVRAVDQRNGMEKWNFSVGQHDVSFLKGKQPSNDDLEEEEVVCEVDDEYDSEDNIPSVKVDMATKTVFAVGGASGRQLLWSHELESCIANAWTIKDGVVRVVDLFQPVTLGLSSGADPQMTPFFSDYSQPMLFIGKHKDQLYVQPSPNTNSEISQAAWAAQRGGQANPQDGSLTAPRVRWRPYAYTSVSRTPTIVAAKNEENLLAAGNKDKGESNRDVSVWNQYPFDNGYYLLHQLTPMHMMPQNRQLEGNESQDGGLEILFSVSVWTWWREIFGTSMLLAIGMQLFFHYVLKPRRKRRAAEKELKDEGEETEEEQVKPPSPELNNGSDPLVWEYKSRYLTDFEHTECLGKGGFGIVFRAKNKVDENNYAVKRITLPNREEARDKVLREARTLAILDHSGIVRYFNSWLEEPPLGWQDIQDKKFVGESLGGNDGLTSLDTPAFFNKNSELIRNHDQLMQQTGGKSGMDPSYVPFSRTRASPILKFDLSDESNVSSEGRVNQKGDNKRAGVESDILFPGAVCEFEESGSFSIVFQGTEEENSQNMSVHSDTGEETPQNLATLDESMSNRSTDTSLDNTMDVPFKHYANDVKDFRDLDRSESFQIVFEDSGCTDQPRYSDSESTQSDTSKSSKNSSTPSSTPCIEGHWKEMSTHHETNPSQTPTTSSVVMKVQKIYLYIQMQLCRKETLKDWLSTNTLSRDRNKVLHIFHQILEAVNYIHGCGMIHRDLKPSNIFFSVDGKIKVGDFGLVTAIDTSMEGAEDSVDGAAGHLHTGRVGTQLYMCPEQVSGQNYDHKVDIFSLGLIFFELFHPFSTTMERITVMCKAKRQDFPKRFTKELPLEAKFAKWLLSYDPDLRPDTDEISESDMFSQLYEDYVPPSYHTVRNRGISNSSR